MAGIPINTEITNTNMDVLHFESMISLRGVPVRWYRAQQCSCWKINGQPLYSCKACEGLGYIYDAPVAESAIIIGGLVLSKEFTPVGDFKMGDCIATIPAFKIVKIDGRPDRQANALFDIGEWDKIVLVNTEYRANKMLVRGQSVYGAPADTLPTEEVTRVARILTSDPDTGDVNIYEEDVDYTVDGNHIEWLPDGASPAEGQQYSTLYFHRPTYVVYTQLPQARDPDGQHFPKKVILRYRDVALNG